MEQASLFIEGMKTQDLQDLYDDPKVPGVVKPFIFRQLEERGEPLEPPEEVVYELDGDEDEEIQDKTLGSD
jgi:hypothetical protein